jgi:3-isopropylmalate/(R)-2-methylmalate dehydratase large subunit
MFVEAYDVHATNFGAVGALAIPLVIEISEVLACGSVWIKVPETVLIKLEGKFRSGTSVRDLGQKIINDLGSTIVDYSVVEYSGSGLASISIEDRQILCNTPIDIGAKSALVEPDEITFEYLRNRTEKKINQISSDADAKFKHIVTYNLDELEPQVAIPPTPDCVVNISEVVGIKVNHAFIGSCAAPGINDLAMAADILKGKQIHKDVRLFITPSTQEVMKEADKKGYLGTFVNAGAMITPPGCGPCAAGKIGGLASGETSINTGTRNDYGRLGAVDSKIFLGSAATVAASAINGKITDPRKINNKNRE